MSAGIELYRWYKVTEKLPPRGKSLLFHFIRSGLAWNDEPSIGMWDGDMSPDRSYAYFRWDGGEGEEWLPATHWMMYELPKLEVTE
jgi:hypothetical protein